MNQFEQKMDEFFVKADDALNSVKKATKTLQWIAGLVIIFVLGLVMDTRIKVEHKVDRSEMEICQESMQDQFLTKKDALTVYEFQTRYYMDIMSKDSIISRNAKHPIMIYNILR